MQVFTPGEVTGKSEESGKKRAANKYLAVLTAAKYARLLNEFPRDRSSSREKKLTTRSLEELAKGGIEFRVIPRRRASVTE
jgi:DNA-directed RNA polymerase subunit K/omega